MPKSSRTPRFEPILGSGPYAISAVRPGESVTFTRDPNYWGRDLPINRGLWNFDQIKFDYYRDGNTHFEAFKKGLYDVRAETDPGRWQTGYDFPALRDGRVVKEEFPYGLPKGMQRAGVQHATSRSLPMCACARRSCICSTSTGSTAPISSASTSAPPAISTTPICRRMAFRPMPANANCSRLSPASCVPTSWTANGRRRPVTAPAATATACARRLALFADAGYRLQGTQLVHVASGRPFTFEILVTTRDQERLALTFSGTLKRAGITAQVRNIDATQFERRRIGFDFDMMEYRWDQSLSPGNEQYFYWGSAAADQQGSRNYMGVKSPAVDAMIGAMLSATAREDFVAATRALDRVLLSGFYVVPLYFPPTQWVARWKRIEHPSHTSVYGYLPETWWQGEAP